MAASKPPAKPKGETAPAEQGVEQQAIVDVGVPDVGEDIVHGQDEEGDDDDLLIGDEVIAASDASGSDEFSLILAELETMMMDEAFNSKVDEFTETHCDQFDEGEENKLEYTSLFSEYTKLVEAHIEEHLGAALKSFDMQAFCASLTERSDAKELPLALEMLSAYGDFEAFKAMMLSCKVGRSLGDMGVVGGKLPVHVDEQEDGEEMPDLNLSISSASGIRG